jgi:hypothetical protein
MKLSEDGICQLVHQWDSCLKCALMFSNCCSNFTHVHPLMCFSFMCLTQYIFWHQIDTSHIIVFHYILCGYFYQDYSQETKGNHNTFHCDIRCKMGKGLLLNEEVMHVSIRWVLASTLSCRWPTFPAMWHSDNNDYVLCCYRGV